MNPNDLISAFQDTMAFSMSWKLKKETKNAMKSSKIYKEGFLTRKNVMRHSEICFIEVNAITTFAEAKKNIALGKVAVLNFANPENAGGGVQFGAMAQEECLCRSSNLYPCIADERLKQEYYQYHINLQNSFYTDRLIYTKSVTVFKDDSPVPQLMPKKEWFQVDVITCAAPYLGNRTYTNLTALKMLFKGRIKNIFEAAIDNDVDVIILGAFGCGAFENPPKIVAEAFSDVIHENNYRHYFKKIIFAIKPSTERCENISAFAREFDCCREDAQYRCSLLPPLAEWRFYSIPKLQNMKNINERDFHDWQRENPYFGKQFAILGDSISTLEGYLPHGYHVFYAGENCQKSGIYDRTDTWWGKVLDFFGGELLVNNSWSGSRVTRLPNSNSAFPSGCSQERTSRLHLYSVKPDVIIVYMGTNDWANGVPVESNQMRSPKPVRDTCFSEAYEMMIEDLKRNYPNAEIWCCTLCSSFISQKPEFSFPYEYGGIHMNLYNNVIRSIANKKQCKLIDFSQYSLPYDSLDGVHPTEAGMHTLAMMTLRTTADDKGLRFLGYEKETHESENQNEADFTHLKKVDGEPCDLDIDSLKNEDEKELALLKIGIKAFVKSNYKDEGALQLLISSLMKAPLILPIQVDIESMLEGLDPTKLKKGDTIQPNHDTRLRILTFSLDDGTEIIPLFTSPEEVHKGPSVSTIQYYPQEYIPMIAKMNKRVVIDPFSETKMVIHAETINDVLLPAVEKKMKCADEVDASMLHQNLIGQSIAGKYNVLQKIGISEGKEIYLTARLDINEFFTMKYLPRDADKYEAVKNIMQHEFQLVQQLNHPMVVKIIETIENEKGFFVIEEYVEGMTLKQILETGGAQPEATVLEWGEQLCTFLSYLHKQPVPIIYRDMKPGNIIVQPNGALKVIDFGIARYYVPGLSSDECSVGTRGYAPPEQYGTAQTDARSDIYSLGVTLHQLLTGVNPAQENKLQNIRAYNPKLSNGMDCIISKCMQPDRNRRYQSCDELLRDLECRLLGFPKNFKK